MILSRVVFPIPIQVSEIEKNIQQGYNCSLEMSKWGRELQNRGGGSK